METKDMIMLLTSGQHLTSAERHEIALHLQILAERLHRQEAEIERLARDREWISVEDRLPELGAKVLGVDREIGKVRSYIFLDYGLLKKTVSHWMFFPKPPKPKEQTFKDVFFKAFPKAIRYSDGTPLSCRAVIFGGKCLLNRPECSGCWNKPYFEEEEGETDA